jgi:hypothetical protein
MNSKSLASLFLLVLSKAPRNFQMQIPSLPLRCEEREFNRRLFDPPAFSMAAWTRSENSEEPSIQPQSIANQAPARASHAYDAPSELSRRSVIRVRDQKRTL